MGWPARAVRVRVPATSANLGPGFDALGLALALHDDVDAWISDSGLSVEISGEGADLASAGEKHLVVRAMRAAFAVAGGQPPGLGLRCVNRIPHGRGLGSSAAAVVAGILAARALSEAGPDHLTGEAVLALATAMDGHPDNVAACLAGGLTIAWTEDEQPRMVRLEPLSTIRPVVCIAPAALHTEVARGLLPDLVPHREAAANAGRSALLIAALTQRQGAALEQGEPADGHGSAGLLLAATQDWLHQGYRAGAMPGTADLVGRLRKAGIPAVISGAGPSVLALLSEQDKPEYRHHLDSLGSIVRETGIAWHTSSLDVERQGARVLRPEPPVGC
jgi:homoserine kinase